MSSGNTVQLTFAGDSKSLEKAFDRVGDSSRALVKDLGKAEDQSKGFGKAMDRAAEATDASESKFMGTADLLDGLGGAFGLPTEGATNMVRSFGDLSGGFATVGPLVSSFGSSLGALATGPVGAVILGVGLLVAAFIALYKNSETVRDFVTSAFDAIKKVAGPVIETVGKVVSWVTGLFGKHKEEVKDTGDAYKAMTDNLRASLDAQQSKWQSWHDRVSGLIDDIQNPLQRARDKSVVSFAEIQAAAEDNVKFFNGWIANLQSLMDRGFGALASKMFELGPTAEKAVGEMTTKSNKELQKLTDQFAAAGDSSTRAFTGAFLSKESLKAMGDAGTIAATSFKSGFTNAGPINVPINRLGPSVPQLADGGIVRSPTLALIGESGPEAVVPLGAGGGGGPQVIQLVLDGRVITEVVHDGLLAKQRRTPLGLN